VLSLSHVKQQAAALGFTFCGVTPAQPSPTLDAYLRWIDAGMHGSMGYMARPDRVARRRDLTVILPGARSLVMVGLDYRTAAVGASVLHDRSRGRIAAYAWGQDYHELLNAKLAELAAALIDTPSAGHSLGVRESGKAGEGLRAYVDTGAILERSHAQQAGFGFVGKNTMLINPRAGSSFFLGEIVADAEFDEYDAPLEPSPGCGSCTRCLTACPTNAFPAPHVLDARLCISYHTIENKGSIPVELRSRFGNWIFGCDICQDVCPFQRFAPITPERALFPVDADRAAPPLAFLLDMTEVQFQSTFAGSPLIRTGRARLVRNACVAAGNSGDSSLAPSLERLAHGDDSIIAEHAAWALRTFSGSNSCGLARNRSV
jgi:epoxyqueuosine reductase